MNNNFFHGNYKTHRDTVLLTIAILIIGFLFSSGKQLLAEKTITIYAKGIETPVSVDLVQPTATPLPDTPESYIVKVFGEYAPKAFQLLQGPECHENLKLDPFAVNDNSLWGGNGRDRGIFQISDYWHPSVTDEMAFDFKQNVDYAYRMFVNDGHTFTRWTCGDFYGI